jgi:hypothetical protein
MSIRMIFADETDKTLTDRNGSTWSFGNLWMNTACARKVLLNGEDYGNHRGWLMMLGDDGYVSILHARRKGGVLHLHKKDMCRMCEPADATKWDRDWNCDWCDTPGWVRTMVSVRYGI